MAYQVNWPLPGSPAEWEAIHPKALELLSEEPHPRLSQPLKPTPSCRECGAIKKPHKAGYCRSCYDLKRKRGMKTCSFCPSDHPTKVIKNHAPRLIIQKGYVACADCDRERRTWWNYLYRECRGCGTTKIRHTRQGYCNSCVKAQDRRAGLDYRCEQCNNQLLRNYSSRGRRLCRTCFVAKLAIIRDAYDAGWSINRTRRTAGLGQTVIYRVWRFLDSGDEKLLTGYRHHLVAELLKDWRLKRTIPGWWISQLWENLSPQQRLVFTNYIKEHRPVSLAIRAKQLGLSRTQFDVVRRHIMRVAKRLGPKIFTAVAIQLHYFNSPRVASNTAILDAKAIISQTPKQSRPHPLHQRGQALKTSHSTSVNLLTWLERFLVLIKNHPNLWKHYTPLERTILEKMIEKRGRFKLVADDIRMDKSQIEEIIKKIQQKTWLVRQNIT